MKRKLGQIYQFHISLDYIQPEIWRIIQVPENYTFWDLHVAIQDSMGWLDYHLHEFRIKNSNSVQRELIGIPDEDFIDERPTSSGWECYIKEYFTQPGVSCQYEYDLGDGWSHKIVLEKILDSGFNIKYPQCIDGRRACPPEDCGGFPGYERLIEIIKNPHDEEFDDMQQWLGEIYEPEKFSPKVRFSNPKTRLKKLLKATT